MKPGTKTTLVQDLNKKPDSPARNYIITAAESGHYHDYESKLATPKIQLVKDLESAGLKDLADKTRVGAYDDEYEGQKI